MPDLVPDLAQLVNLGLGFALAAAGRALIAHHVAANTPATLVASVGGYAIALVAFTGWAWVGQGGAGLVSREACRTMVAATLLLYRQFQREWS